MCPVCTYILVLLCTCDLHINFFGTNLEFAATVVYCFCREKDL
jgi:hypothetical protein